MNARFKYLPLTLLLSVAAYGMHDSGTVTQIEDELSPITLAEKLPAVRAEQQETVRVEAKKAMEKMAAKKAEEPVMLIFAEASTIMHSASKPEPVKQPEAAASASLTNSATGQSKNLGVSTWLSDTLWGEAAVVASELAKNKFDSKIPANNRRLFKAIESKTKTKSAENLKDLKEIFTNCRTQTISVADVTVLAIVREFAHIMRTEEEDMLKKEANQALQASEKERGEIIADLQKKFTESIDRIQQVDKKLTNDLDNVYKKHEETILLGTEVKRLSRLVNDHLPKDGYDSDIESKYDREFNSDKLSLRQPTDNNHKLNKRTEENLAILKTMAELVDKQAIKQKNS